MTRSHYHHDQARGQAPGPARLRRAEADPEDRQTDSLAALALVLALVVAGLFLVRVLQAKSTVEDCLLAGRRNCDVVLVHCQAALPFGP